MTVTTSKGKTFDTDWMWGPVGADGQLMLEYADGRALSEIAADFEGVERFHRESETEGDRDWDGYTRLRSVMRSGGGKVQIALEREEQKE